MPNNLLEITRISEEMLLGSIMLASCYLEGGIHDEYRQSLIECWRTVKPEHFYHPDHARYYKAMQKYEQPDIIGVLLQLARDNELKQQDKANLLRFLNVMPSAIDLTHYARIVVELWEQRTGKTIRRRGIAI